MNETTGAGPNAKALGLSQGLSNAQNEVRDLTFEIARETESQEVRDAITRIREQLTDSFGIVHQNALNRVNADIKNLGKRPNISQPQIPN